MSDVPSSALTVEQAAILHLLRRLDDLEQEVSALRAALGQEAPPAKSGRK